MQLEGKYDVFPSSATVTTETNVSIFILVLYLNLKNLIPATNPCHKRSLEEWIKCKQSV